ncbi:zinc ABC transporter substrate-binding protein [Rhodococcus rhodnii]|uniref:Iron ABC transporter substrate-binding component n=2 Tax=Rhodococcus rhodnii TaxID=38312 RepID=R7WQF1_9NOCA|nr:ABC transporter substrate-binding protein [Rhodococcus rhodnii]EOM77533.1 iron ABC transporter substrate-binding component [Rhodococcus rhodnii LMG 5362]TXG90995.1 zinc ABC transporter substrate-binding protein [Rhodococcus rhodnii]
MNTIRLAATAAAVASLLTVAACGSGVEAARASGETTTTVENCGRTVGVDAPPQRVVTLSPSQTELLVELGVADALVGLGQTDTSPLPPRIAAEVADVPVLSTDTPPNREVLLDAAPDFVVSPTEYEFTAEQGFASIEQLGGAGAQVYVAAGGCAERRTSASVEDLFTDIDGLGAVFDRTERAEELIAQSRARLAAVDEQTSAGPQRTVAQVYVEGNSLSVIGAGVEADIVARAGGKNVFRPDEPMFSSFFAATVGPEELAARDPEALVFAVSDDAQRDATLDYLRTTFPDMRAVRDDRLVAVPGSDLFPGTLGNVTAVEAIAAGLR